VTALVARLRPVHGVALAVLGAVVLAGASGAGAVSAPPGTGSAVDRLAAGAFLVASRGLRDPNFARTVVLLLRHGPQGSVGLVVNRPTHLSLAEALPELPELAGRQELVRYGGPVSLERVTLLIRSASPPEGSAPVLSDVHMSGSLDTLRAFLADGRGGTLHAYAGYAGWAGGQLASELRRGDWHLTAGDAGTVFDKPAAAIWPELERRFTGRWAGRRPAVSLVVAQGLELEVR
jgi:putative transcriptional regulator